MIQARSGQICIQVPDEGGNVLWLALQGLDAFETVDESKREFWHCERGKGKC